MRVRCKSGLTGWRERLRKNYADFAEFKNWSDMFGLHTRLGYRSPESAWRRNPVVEGSVEPSDFQKAPKRRI